MANILFLLLFIVLFPRLGSSQDECTTVSQCKENGQAIKFPFWLKNHQPERCGYPGFELYCGKANETFLKLSFSVSLLVMKIDYKNQVIQVYDPVRSLIRLLLKDNLSDTPFQLIRNEYKYDYSLYNCSAKESDPYGLVPYLDIRIEEDGDAIVMKKLTIVGLWCIQWYPVDRPSMKEVVQMLEGEGENMSMPPNPFTAATKRTITNAGPHGRVVEQELSVLLELE
ncbi:hypothetical protein LguiA_026224 [Lonicera macranthoides]